MEEIRRRDLILFAKELLTPWRLAGFILLSLFAYASLTGRHMPIQFSLVVIVGWLAGLASSAYSTSVSRRFSGKRHRDLWEACRDRLVRFEEVLKRMKRTKAASLEEMPRTIRRIAEQLYVALRRADTINTEVERTEKEMFGKPPAWTADSKDPQSQELYRQADKNIAEYRQQYMGVMAGVQRTEAQCAVFMTTVDTLRMKMLGYRLASQSPEMVTSEFLSAITEAKLQLQAIDKALDELELGPYPKMIAAMPTLKTASEEQHIEQR